MAGEVGDQLTHQSVSSIRTPVTDRAWRYLPTSYLLCTRDRAIHPAAQAVMSARCDQVHRLRPVRALFSYW
ncbi:hypothetical protein GCM10027436_69020 [Actinophytocola sediminis]